MPYDFTLAKNRVICREEGVELPGDKSSLTAKPTPRPSEKAGAVKSKRMTSDDIELVERADLCLRAFANDLAVSRLPRGEHKEGLFQFTAAGTILDRRASELRAALQHFRRAAEARATTELMRDDLDDEIRSFQRIVWLAAR
ncbi:hypothetical protein SAMN05216456_1589 [Devosia crocina]|uniref:Uncharacterized protein n=1 Tax=Devosia crocina TaxID=429728 RepID=A0A1I7NCA2_9HYPH|nr:hypothetical protein [Devosia crocina]SFV32261.1 hypothetical protein SAMN05216456_1589 [Devosia crocina]